MYDSNVNADVLLIATNNEILIATEASAVYIIAN